MVDIISTVGALCRVCGFSLVEDPSARELGEKAQVVLVPGERSSLRESQAEHARYQTLTLVLRGICRCM